MNKSTIKKSEQLGQSSSKASHRLVKDILWNFVLTTNNNKCFHCGLDMCRKTFSIEHKIPWLDSENPVELFFSLENISFSHLRCNIAAARKPWKRLDTENCKLERRLRKNENRRRTVTPEKRRERYLRTGH